MVGWFGSFDARLDGLVLVLYSSLVCMFFLWLAALILELYSLLVWFFCCMVGWFGSWFRLVALVLVL